MKQVFEGLKGVLVYLDDVLLHGNTQEEHDTRLQLVLERIRKHGLSFNAAKC
jgi:hypothetical protein